MIAVHDDVLVDAEAYRQIALTQPYETVAGFHGIAPPPDTSLEDWLAVHYPTLTPVWSFLRRSPLGQVEPNFRHDDGDMGDFTVILYLNPDPPAGDGTDLWARDPAGDWTREIHIAAQWNRLALFPAVRTHSRALFDNYGTGSEARLVQVIFLQGSV